MPKSRVSKGKTEAKFSRSASIQLTSSALIEIDYIAPPIALSDYITTLYHFRCDEEVFRDIQPSSVGHLTLFPFGKGHIHFPGGRVDPNPEIALLTPMSKAAPIVVNGPFHSIGAALTPLGWASLTQRHAREYGNRLVSAGDVLGDDVVRFGEPLLNAYRKGTVTGRDFAMKVAEFIGQVVRPINPRHADLIRIVNEWLGSSFNPEVSDLMAKAAYSERQVQRLVERYFGLPPKDIARKYRALRAAALLSFPKLTPDYEAALGEAFFDQSHMIREINRFVGRTPARLGADDSPFLNEMIAPQNLRELDPRWGKGAAMLRPIVDIGKTGAKKSS